MTLTKRKNSPENEELIENGDAPNEGRSNIKGDELNIAVLLFLYTLQGIPLGLAGAVPMLLQNKGITYTQQAEFSLVNWPFSVKLLWAPIVDAMFWPEFGRRKTWLVPVQYLIGIVMIIVSYCVTDWLGIDGEPPSMTILTVSFLLLNFLAATQDIAVDGWALTMLKRCNVGHASTCNTVGQTAGFFLGYVMFLALESPYFCNKYLRTEPQETGLVTLSSFLLFWGWIFIITTTFIAIFKHEANDTSASGQVKGGNDIVSAYKQLYTIVKLPAVRKLALVLFTAKLGFCAADAVSGLKLVEAGVPREDLALLAVPLVPVQIIMPVILAKHTTGPAPLSLWLKAFPLRLLVGPLAAALVAFTPTLLGDSGPSYSYLSILMLLYVFHQTCLYCMFVAVMAFFAKVSDPTVGGTYMTLLNTVSNLGTNWPSTLALWAIDHLTYKSCSLSKLTDNKCSSTVEAELCKSEGGTCVTEIDGYYIETVICVILGFLWLQWGRPTINRLQRLPPSAWQISRYHR
ncbi:acetyl-coenzyme A transporter 1 [Bombyx mandarina]|uniref:Acetyl-coenzyme A transporter 1 n=2 Tax=Bombyx TaxID=7090 RepID=A0A8R2AM59_BOMMO|nr:acetyl-coenzyme A transporter 1 [Bombyx mori]XP_012551004.1 acetyl-coenzyme A transporter 1 [Bombyx mori]XP_028042866.1 acetyl-coenzyme A transporter 1 [Bombyx mandarina]XP_028042868.1 acetyl-coenzyme A transporter 1 [Bombyx mandarina]XP_028042869.1 acetyl-coenzyme A transporter 1 [Bombyx mandarina]